MGISVSYASSLLTDPTGEIDRARKRKYLNRCPKCGTLTHGKYCLKHSAKEVAKQQRKWTRGDDHRGDPGVGDRAWSSTYLS